MHPRLRPLLATFGALALALSARAQFEALLTESPVTLQATFTTSTTTTTATERRDVLVTSRLSQQQIIQDIVGGSDAGWSLVAVRYVPADLSQVDTDFDLYAVNGNDRVRVPRNKLSFAAGGSVARYRERHIGQYVLSSSGTVTNHVSAVYRPGFTLNNAPLTTDIGFGDGFSTISYTSRDELGGYGVFFYQISSVRGTLRGGLLLSNGQEGLVNLSLTLGAPRLVPATLYPLTDAVPPEPRVTYTR